MHIKSYFEFINEASINSIEMSDILTDKYIKSYIDDGYADGLLYYYANKDEYDDEDEARESEGFYDLVKNELENNFEDAFYNISDRIYSGKITIFRAMTVADDWVNHLKKQGKRLGIYWSWDEDAAEAHWGKNHKNTAVLKSEIAEKHVNWKSTLENNVNSSLSDEREITLYKNTPIKLLGLTINGKEVDISELKDKKFYA